MHKSATLYRHCEQWQAMRKEMALAGMAAAADNDNDIEDEWAFHPIASSDTGGLGAGSDSV